MSAINDRVLSGILALLLAVQTGCPAAGAPPQDHVPTTDAQFRLAYRDHFNQQLQVAYR